MLECFTSQSTLMCADVCGEPYLCAAVSFNVMQFGEMKCNLTCTCTAATRVTSAGWRTARGSYDPIKLFTVLLALCCFVSVISGHSRDQKLQ